MTIDDFYEILDKCKWFFSVYTDNNDIVFTIDGELNVKKLKKELKNWKRK